MPCWQITRMEVKFKAQNRQLLDAAIKALGWRVVGKQDSLRIYTDRSAEIEVNLPAEKATIVNGDQNVLNQLNRAYSQQVLQQMPTMLGWQNQIKNPLEGSLVKGVLQC
jgi:hypothetical protein